MNDTLAYLRGHRIWLVRDFQVWGSLAANEFMFLISVNGQSNKRILFMNTPLGGELQKVSFADLKDFRGNSLPEKLVNPKVAVFSKSSNSVVIVGREDSESFSIARTSTKDPGPLCDLLIIELG